MVPFNTEYFVHELSKKDFDGFSKYDNKMDSLIYNLLPSMVLISLLLLYLIPQVHQIIHNSFILKRTKSL